MPWDVHLLHSVVLLVLLRGKNVNAVSQESVYVIECIRDMVPNQIFNDCCVRENNCSVTRQQNKGIDCMSRMIMSNFSYLFSDSRNEGASMTTDHPYQHQHQHQYQDRNQNWYSDILETLAETCRRQPKGRTQNCIRNELIKRCRYSMLQDRVTSSPGHWSQRTENRFEPDSSRGGSGVDNRRRMHQLYGSRRYSDDGYQDGGRYQGSAGYGSSSGSGNRGRTFSRINYNSDGDTDEEDFGYIEADSSK